MEKLTHFPDGKLVYCRFILRPGEKVSLNEEDVDCSICRKEMLRRAAADFDLEGLRRLLQAFQRPLLHKLCRLLGV